MTVTTDNVDVGVFKELHKIATVFPDAKVIISIAVDDSKLVCHFNSKFGSPPQEWDLSCHVGLGCGDLCKPFVASAIACSLSRLLDSS